MKGYRYGMGAVLAILAVFALYSCFLKQGKERDEASQVRIGITLYREDDTFLNSICRVLEEKAKEYEKNTGIRIILDVVDAR